MLYFLLGTIREWFLYTDSHTN